MHYISRVLAILALIVIIIFSVQNWDSVNVSFLNWSLTVPIVVLVIGVYILGMVSGWSLVHLFQRGLSKKPD